MPPPMLAALWIGLLDLHERLANSWNLIGGQALVGEAAALSNAGGPGLGRLRREFVRTPIAIRLPTADRTDSDSVAGARHRAGLVGHPVAGSRVASGCPMAAPQLVRTGDNTPRACLFCS
jgi:hypothetical protein